MNNFSDASAARKYVANFKHMLDKDASWVQTSSGRIIRFDTMTDDDAIWVATQLRGMEIEASRRSRRGKPQ